MCSAAACDQQNHEPPARTRHAAASGVVLKSPASSTSGAAGPAPLERGPPSLQAPSAAAASRCISCAACRHATILVRCTTANGYICTGLLLQADTEQKRMGGQLLRQYTDKAAHITYDIGAEGTAHADVPTPAMSTRGARKQNRGTSQWPSLCAMRLANQAKGFDMAIHI